MTAHRQDLVVALAGALWAAVLAGCPEPAQRQCGINSDCAKGMYCLNGLCRRDCRADFDCKIGRCDTTVGKCTTTDAGLPAPDLTGGPRDLNMGGAVDLAEEQPPDDLRTPPAPDLAQPPMVGAYGDVCTADTQCRSGLCSKNPFAVTDKECVGPCGGGCMIGDFCVNSLGICAQSDIGNACGAGADCRAGACLLGGGPGFCTKTCSTAAECPAGYSCSIVNTGSGLVRVCVNVDATPACTSDSQCWYGTMCDATYRRCLGECSSNAHCPLFHSCLNVGGRAMCRPNGATGRGGIGATCNQANSGNDCRAGACLGTFCLTACGVTAQVGQFCPGGWGCNPIDDGAGGYILGCLPAGKGSPGAPCADNTSCASGLCLTDDKGQTYCTRFCNSAPCPAQVPSCQPLGVVADGVNLMACSK